MRRLYAAAVFVGWAVGSSPATAGDAAALFAQNCQLCHQAGAQGLPGQFPRLAGRLSAISKNADGRVYLADVLTYGLSGTVRVDDQQIIGLMPPFAVLPNEVVADILNYVQSLGTEKSAKGGPAKLFTESEIAAARAKSGKTIEDVQNERRALQRLKIIE